MTPLEFSPFLINNIEMYFIILILFSFVYLFSFKFIFSVFDPLFLILIGSLFSTVMVVFLYNINLIDEKYYYYYLISEMSFFIGLAIFFKTKENIFNSRSKYNSLRVDHMAMVKSMMLVSSF